MKIFIIGMLLTALLGSVPVYADETEDRIAEIEARIAELTEELDSLNNELAELKPQDEYIYEMDGHTYKYLRNEYMRKTKINTP